VSTKKYAFFGLILIGALAQSAFAGPVRGISDAYVAYRGVITNLSQGDIETPVTAAVGAIVADGISALREAGQYGLANKYEAEWAARYHRTLTAADFVPGLRHSKDDLGDHAPASQWLANFYDTLVKQTRGIIRQIRAVEDINTLNYALPVVFAPHGTWRTGLADADKIEYRKHFIPFANIITYWVADELCNWAVKRYVPEMPGLKQVCDPAASRLEFYMGRYIAWQISDFIFARANGLRKDAELADFAVISESDFEAEVLASMGGLK
jgi:hypothetical protein